MHNNFTLDKTPKPSKAFYTAVEAAVLWARSEGAKAANDPRIAYYNKLILEAVKNGALYASKEESTEPLHQEADKISSADLKEWLKKNHPNARPDFYLKTRLLK